MIYFEMPKETSLGGPSIEDSLQSLLSDARREEARLRKNVQAEAHHSARSFQNIAEQAEKCQRLNSLGEDQGNSLRVDRSVVALAYVENFVEHLEKILGES